MLHDDGEHKATDKEWREFVDEMAESLLGKFLDSEYKALRDRFGGHEKLWLNSVFEGPKPATRGG